MSYKLQVTFDGKAQLWCDNLGAVVVSINLVLHSKIKYLELDLFFVREKEVAGMLKVGHLLAHEQVINFLTKPMSKPSFCKFRHILYVENKFF